MPSAKTPTNRERLKQAFAQLLTELKGPEVAELIGSDVSTVYTWRDGGRISADTMLDLRDALLKHGQGLGSLFIALVNGEDHPATLIAAELQHDAEAGMHELTEIAQRVLSIVYAQGRLRRMPSKGAYMEKNVHAVAELQRPKLAHDLRRVQSLAMGVGAILGVHKVNDAPAETTKLRLRGGATEGDQR